MIRTSPGIVLIVAMVALAACAGRKSRAPASTSTAAAAPDSAAAEDMMRAPAVSDELASLDADNAALLEQAGWTDAALDLDLDAASATPMSDAAQICEPPAVPSAACADVCTIAGKICDNAERICHLAEGLPGDPGAEETCTRNKARCTSAMQRCCDC